MENKVVFLGEAYGKNEAELRSPFVGSAGQEFYRMLGDAGFHSETLPYNFVSPFSMKKRWNASPFTLLNVFNERSPDPKHKDRADFFYGHPSDGEDKLDMTLPPRRIGQAKYYIRKEYAHHVRTLRKTLERLQPNLIVALGNTPLWALDLPTGIGKLRGNIIQSPYGKVLPAYHPAAILKNWKFRIVSVIDFMKAHREMASPNVKTMERFIWTEPTVNDLYKWWEEHGSKAKLLAVDIETIRYSQISEIGFASSPTQALHVPFVLEIREGNRKRYPRWFTPPDELKAWKFIKMVLESDVPKIGQNVLQYDCYWLAKELGISPRNVLEDTMVKAHCWQPEFKKDLGFLGSVFLNEREWKSIRTDVAKGDG